MNRGDVITNVLVDEDEPMIFRRPDSSSARDQLSANVVLRSHPFMLQPEEVQILPKSVKEEALCKKQANDKSRWEPPHEGLQHGLQHGWAG